MSNDFTAEKAEKEVKKPKKGFQLQSGRKYQMGGNIEQGF